MREFFTKRRIWYFASFLVQLGCGFLIFAPHFSYVEDGASVRMSVPDFYEEIGLGSIYATAMVVYFFASAPLLIGGLTRLTKRWPGVFSLVIAGLYTLLNALWFTLVWIAGATTTATFTPTVWFFVYLVFQLGTIADLIALIIKMKPEKEIKKKKRW